MKLPVDVFVGVYIQIANVETYTLKAAKTHFRASK